MTGLWSTTWTMKSDRNGRGRLPDHPEPGWGRSFFLDRFKEYNRGRRRDAPPERLGPAGTDPNLI